MLCYAMGKTTWNYNLTEIPYKVNKEVTPFAGREKEVSMDEGISRTNRKGKKPKALGTMSNIFKRSCDCERTC